MLFITALPFWACERFFVCLFVLLKGPASTEMNGKIPGHFNKLWSKSLNLNFFSFQMSTTYERSNNLCKNPGKTVQVSAMSIT